MNARTPNTLPAFGTEIEGGFFHGAYMLDGQLWGEVTAARLHEVTGAWLPTYDNVPGAEHTFDGLRNTAAMAEAGSPIARLVRELRVGGFDDWYIPARGAQLLQWENLVRTQLLREEEAFDAEAWYWSSTQHGRNLAWSQDFGGGDSDGSNKSWEGGRARAVRRFLIG